MNNLFSNLKKLLVELSTISLQFLCLGVIGIVVSSFLIDLSSELLSLFRVNSSISFSRWLLLFPKLLDNVLHEAVLLVESTLEHCFVSSFNALL